MALSLGAKRARGQIDCSKTRRLRQSSLRTNDEPIYAAVEPVSTPVMRIGPHSCTSYPTGTNLRT